MALQTENDTLADTALDPSIQLLFQQVETTKRPLIITRDGHSRVVILDAEAYEQEQRKFAIMREFALGKQEIADGLTYTHEEVEAMIDEWQKEDA